MKVLEWFKKTTSSNENAIQTISSEDAIETISSEDAIQTLRNSQSLDSSSTAFMMADVDLNIIYANKAVLTLLKNLEKDIQDVLPNFSATTIAKGYTVDDPTMFI